MNAIFAVVVFSLVGPLAAQSASSRNYFLSSVELASGEEADTLLYKLRPAQGAGLVPEPDSRSTHYVMTGGFPATLDAPVIGRPWITGVRPFYVPQRGSPTLTIHGTELNLGPSPTVTIGGQTASVGVREVDRMSVTLPVQPVPGYQRVLVSNTMGDTVLTSGVGVLPMLELLCPLQSTVPGGLRFRGTVGDVMILALGIAIAPTPFVLDGFGYSLQIDQSFLAVSSGYVLSGSDTIDFVVPPLTVIGTILVQAFDFGSTNPGYAPGSFTNVVRI